MTGHREAEAFALLNAWSLKPISLPVESLGSVLTVTARGPGENLTVVSRPANGEAMRPLSPAHLEAAIALDGTLSVRWVPRSRLAWSWSDEVAAAADPAVQGYRLRLTGTAAAIERDVAEALATFTPAEAASLGAGPIEVQVRQVGTLALSRPETITINPEDFA